MVEEAFLHLESKLKAVVGQRVKDCILLSAIRPSAGFLSPVNFHGLEMNYIGS